MMEEQAVPRTGTVRWRMMTRALVGVGCLALPLLTGRAAFAGAVAWTPLGPDGGEVSALATDGAGAVYAGTAGGMIFRSDDGSHWKSVSPGVFLSVYTFPSVTDLSADPLVAGSVLAATSFGLRKSSDGGASWTTVSTSNTPPTLLARSAAAHLTVFGYTIPVPPHQPPALVRSDDGGATWQDVSAGLALLPTFSVFVADPQTPGLLYVGTDDGAILRSADGGVHWNTSQLPAAAVQSIAVAPSDPAVVYTIADGELFASADAGSTWLKVSTNLVAWTFTQLAVDPSSPATLVAGLAILNIPTFAGQALARSVDGGETWVVEQEFAPVVSRLLTLPSAPGHVYAGVRGGPGVLRSEDDGVAWSPSNDGLSATNVAEVTPDPHTPGTLYAVGDFGVAKSIDRGSTWSDVSPGTSYPRVPPPRVQKIVADPVTPGSVYAVTDQGIFKSHDAGLSWEPIGIGPGFSVTSLAIDPKRPNRLYAVGHLELPTGTGGEASYPRAALSRDGGATWAEIPRLERPTGFGFTAVRLDPVHPATIYVTGYRSFKSVDGGRTWHHLPVPEPAAGVPDSVIIVDLVIDPLAPRTLYALNFFGNILKSVDGGATFTLTANIPGFPGPGTSGEEILPTSLAIDPDAPGLLYAASTTGVFVSTDGAATWTRFGDGLDLVPVSSLFPDPFSVGTLYAASQGAGVFVSSSAP